MPPADDHHWESETDLLVIGAGAAGMTAALVGKLEGLPQDRETRYPW
jgi:succinate dehydrogenase/fumarate reductase flavoprotein subunit